MVDVTQNVGYAFSKMNSCLKVVLPTFILEKRSLLEMFADCMAHPDLFLRCIELYQRIFIEITANIYLYVPRIDIII